MPKKEETKPVEKKEKSFDVADRNGKVFSFSKEEDAKEHAVAIDGRLV